MRILGPGVSEGSQYFSFSESRTKEFLKEGTALPSTRDSSEPIFRISLHVWRQGPTENQFSAEDRSSWFYNTGQLVEDFLACRIQIKNAIDECNVSPL
jgi:hypothetical protein